MYSIYNEIEELSIITRKYNPKKNLCASLLPGKIFHSINPFLSV